jgi:hypothetical protein
MEASYIHVCARARLHKHVIIIAMTIWWPSPRYLDRTTQIKESKKISW